MPIAADISAIHDQRSAKAEAADGLRADLGRIQRAVQQIELVRAGLAGRVDDEKAAGLLASWAAPLQELADQSIREQALLERAIARLRRPALNIGIVGRARQGKSRFLQSLTGLGPRVIPDGAKTFCTGAPSLVQHVPGDDTYADVFFHSAASFLGEVIGPYFDQLGLGDVPLSPDEFARRPLPPLPAGASESAYAHLETYHRSFPDYGTLLGAPSPRRVGEDQIRGYVAQDDGAGRPLHAFRAVRRVHIATRFPHADLGGVGVIDLPGLGDTNLGDSRVLLAALQDDVDIVLFLRRPAADGDGIHDYDVQLYDTARLALPEIPMDRRSFLILNHRVSEDLDNGVMCEAFRDLVAASPAIRVAGVQIADCSDAGEVTGAFEPVVRYLLANIRELDQLLLAERVRRCGELHREAGLLAGQLSGLAALAQPSSQSFRAFQDLFEETYDNLSVGIGRLVKAYREQRDQPSEPLSDAIQATLGRARAGSGIPVPAEIERLFYREGERIRVYNNLLDESRAHLSRHFLTLDAALRESVERMQADVAGVLAGDGQLARLSDRSGRLFLTDIAGRVPPDIRQDGDSEIRFALEIIAEFELSYRSFIQHRIRPKLDRMHSDNPEFPFPQGGDPPNEHQIFDLLDETYQHALYECELELKELLAEPNRAVFGIVEEFSDRVLRSRRVVNEWRAFYEDQRAEIWTEQLAALAEKAVHLRTWNEAVRELAEAAAPATGAEAAGGHAA